MTQCWFNRLKVERRSLIHAGNNQTRSPESLRAPHEPTLDRVQRRLRWKVSGRPPVFHPTDGCVARRAYQRLKPLIWLGAHGLPGRASRCWITEATRKRSRPECISPVGGLLLRGTICPLLGSLARQVLDLVPAPFHTPASQFVVHSYEVR